MHLKVTTVITIVTTYITFGADHSLAQNSSSVTVFEPKAIYGDDDRIEVYAANELHRKAAQSVAALFFKPSLSIGLGSTDSWSLSDQPTLRDKGWCENEPFSDQPAIAFCTGFLVGSDKLVTSAHCAYEGKKDRYKDGELCSDIAVVFDYKISGQKNSKAAGGQPLDEQQLYFCDNIVSARYERTGSDWAVLQLDRPVEGRMPLALYTQQRFEENASISVIGHPLGLPAKVSTNASVLEQSRSDYVVTDLDTYEGNSGSPVFISVTDGTTSDEMLQVIGILSRGEKDEELVVDNSSTDDDATCTISRRCDVLPCKGEHVTRITELPKL